MNSRNQVNIQPPSMQPSRDQITADFVASGQPIEQPGPNPLAQIAGGISEAGMGILKGIGDFITTQKETPEGRYLLTNMLAGITVGLGADPQIGANLVQQGQEQYRLGLAKQEKESERQFELEKLGLKQKAETKKAERKAVADAEKDRLASIAALEKEERQSRRDFAKAGFIPKLTDDPNLPPELLIEFTSPVSGEPVKLVKQSEATKRQVNVFQDGQITKMYAYTADDAKQIKKTTETKQKIDAITNKLIELRNKYGSETLPNAAKTDMKKYYRQLQLAFKDLNNLGVISDSDYKNFIEPSVPDPTRYASPGTVVEELKDSIQFAEDRLQDIYESRVYNYQRTTKPMAGDTQENANNFKYDTQGNIIVPENLKSLSTASIPQLNIVDGYTVRVKQ